MKWEHQKKEGRKEYDKKERTLKAQKGWPRTFKYDLPEGVECSEMDLRKAILN